MDWYVGVLLSIAAYGAAVGVLSFTENDRFREFLYDVRLIINYALTYTLVSRIPQSLAQVHYLWKWLLVFGVVFFLTNIIGWFTWVYGFGFSPLGALGLGPLVLTDAGNVFFLAYLALLGFAILLTGTSTRLIRTIAGILGTAAFLVLLISLRRGQMVSVSFALLITLLLMATRQTLTRTWRFSMVATLAVTAVILSGTVDLGKYARGVLTLLDPANASTTVRAVGNENMRMNLERHDLWLSGLGLGRRYEYFIVSPEGENLSAFGEDELGQPWRHTVNASNPFLINWVRYGVVVGTFAVLLAWLMPLYVWAQSRKFKTATRLHQVLIITTLMAFFSPFVTVVGPADPKNAIISGFLLGLCSATMYFTRPETSARTR